MSSSDDTPTWRKNKPRMQTSDDRALQHRPQKSSPGIPMPVEEPPDLTAPFDMFEREPDDEARAIVQRSRRNSGDPATVDDIAKVLVVLHRERSANAQRNVDTEVVLQGPHKAHKATRRHLIAAIIAAGASIGAAAKQWSEHATGSGSVDSVRIELLQKSVDRIDNELREIRAILGRRSELSPAGAELAEKGTVQ